MQNMCSTTDNQQSLMPKRGEKKKKQENKRSK